MEPSDPSALPSEMYLPPAEPFQPYVPSSRRKRRREEDDGAPPRPRYIYKHIKPNEEDDRECFIEAFKAAVNFKVNRYNVDLLKTKVAGLEENHIDTSPWTADSVLKLAECIKLGEAFQAVAEELKRQLREEREEPLSVQDLLRQQMQWWGLMKTPVKQHMILLLVAVCCPEYLGWSSLESLCKAIGCCVEGMENA